MRQKPDYQQGRTQYGATPFSIGWCRRSKQDERVNSSSITGGEQGPCLDVQETEIEYSSFNLDESSVLTHQICQLHPGDQSLQWLAQHSRLYCDSCCHEHRTASHRAGSVKSRRIDQEIFLIDRSISCLARIAN